MKTIWMIVSVVSIKEYLSLKVNFDWTIYT